MAKITRQTLIPFGGDGPSADFGQFGSQAASAPIETKDIATIQALDAWKNGFQDAVALGEAPYLQDMNSVLYVLGTELAYVLQEGVAEFDSSTTYYIGSIVKKTGTFELYGSLVDTNLGNALPTRVSDANWAYLGLLNSLAAASYYKRPQIAKASSTTVDMEDKNVVGVNGTTVRYRDGVVRTTSNATLTRLNLGRVAVITGGGKQSGLQSGTVANNTWYSCFSVKSQDSDDNIHVAVPLDCIPSNYATFNGYWGVNGWIYLGPVRYGNNGNTAAGVLDFQQCGDRFVFDNSLVIQSQGANGLSLADAGAASTLSWAYSGGMGAAQVPQSVVIGTVSFVYVWGGAGTVAATTGNSGTVFRLAFASNVISAMNSPAIDLKVASGLVATAPANSAMAIVLQGFIDSALAN